MIAKMKKLIFLAYHKDYQDFLNSLRELGVVHIAEKQQGMLDNTQLQEDVRLLNRLIVAQKLLSNQKLGKIVPNKEGGTSERGIEVLDQIDDLLNDKSKYNQQLQSYGKDIAMMQAWGDFNPSNINRLSDAGYVVNFYTCPESAYQSEWEDAYNAIKINTISSKVFFITLTSANQEIDIDAELVKLPSYSLAQLNELYVQTEKDITDNQAALEKLAADDVPSVKKAIDKLQGEIEFSKVVLSTEQAAGEKLMILEGWVPVKNTLAAEAFLNESQVYYQISDPSPEDNVPIEFSNSKFFAWFEPICRLYMLPRYNELDLTPFLAPFFMVFFGLCLGDSGYGLFLFTGATLWKLFDKKLKMQMKGILSLVQILAVSTFFCGLLTGTFFGANIYDLPWPFIQKMKNAIFLDNNEMFQLSLILGVIQILFGMVLKAVNQAIQFGFKYSLSTIGWIILLVSTGFAALLPDVMAMDSLVYYILLGISVIFIFGFNSPGKNIFLNIGLGFWDSYNMVTGLLGDILSYVRLFALGLSGGILAGVFNSLAVGMKPDNVIAGPIVMVLIFLIGHAINIFMNVLGAMVHPMRLTFVEFFKNAGYTGGGKEYKPFKKI